MQNPDPRQTPAVVDALRRHGSIMWPADHLPVNFTGWRRNLRRAAREADLRVSVRRVNDMVFVEHLDHVVTDDDMRATMRVMNDPDFGTGRGLDFDDALHIVRRERLQIVEDDPTN